MSKAYLIMDMPSGCSKCPFVEHEDEGWLSCSICGYEMAYVYTRADYCPLRELPQKKEKPTKSEAVTCFNSGYNACIDEIMRGSEENG